MVPRILLAFVLFLSWFGYMNHKRLQREHFVDGVNEEMEQVKVVSTGVWGSTFKTRGLPRTGQCRMQRIYFGYPERKSDATRPRSATAQRISKVGLWECNRGFAISLPSCEVRPMVMMEFIDYY
jgi:hypothetical protein